MFRFALRNLLSRPVRSLLSLLGLTVAIVGMVGLFSVARGIDRTLHTTFGRMSGMVAMQPGSPIPLFSRLPADWEQEIRAVPGVATVNAEVWARANLINGKMIISPPRFLFGIDVHTRQRLKADPYQLDMLPGQGRFLNSQDAATNNTVISKQIAEEFHVEVGDDLVVNNETLHIVGIYFCDSLLLDVSIILDIDKVRAMSRFDRNSVSCFYIENNGDVDDETLQERIRAIFRGREPDAWQPSASNAAPGTLSGWLGSALDFLNQKGKARPDEKKSSVEKKTNEKKTNESADSSTPSTPRPAPDAAKDKSKTGDTSKASVALEPDDETNLPIEVRSLVEWADRFKDLTADLNLFLGVMTAIGVTIAVLSIVNTMLMSVTERFIEFGILKANGWSRADVLKLITFESATLGLGGGLFGTLLGWIAVQVINANWPDRVQLYASPGLLTFSIIFATALGVLGGLYPAIWAMRMSPMDAIRRG